MIRTISAFGLAGLLALASCGKDEADTGKASDENAAFSVRGELLKDGRQDIPSFGPVYRIFIRTEKGVVTYPFLASENEISEMSKRYVSREDSGTEGNYIGVNPNTNMFTLDEVMLSPENIRLIRSHGKK